VLAEGVHRSSPAIMTQPNIPLIPRPANGCLETCSSGVTRMLLAFRLQLFVSDIIGKTRRLSINHLSQRFDNRPDGVRSTMNPLSSSHSLTSIQLVV
jgi:hypothetical protein